MTSTHVIKLIEESRVAPPPGSAPKNASLPFTFFDIFWIYLPPVDRLFFYPYPHPTSHFVSSLLPSLKSSLSLTLEKYYPLAGNYRRTPDTEDKFEHYYTDGDSISFTVAESDGNFDNLSKDQEREVSLFEGLVPKLQKSNDLQPLFSVQVTIFPNQGIIIGTSVNHTACDGSSSMQFTQAWAATCRSGGAPLPSSQVPIFDRNLIPDPSNLYSLFYNQMKRMMESFSEGPKPVFRSPSDLVLATFTLRKNHIQRLKELISTEMAKRNTSFHCSTIVVAFAYMLVGFAKLKEAGSAKKACLGIPADFRSRISPRIPENYFGNCIGSCMPSVEISDLIKEDGIVSACLAIGMEIEKLKDGLKGAENWFDKYGSISKNLILSVAGSPKFRVYDVDFGFGKPNKVEIISATKTGAMSTAESREDEGGIEIGMSFTKSEMDLFKDYFSNGLKILSE
ncbi:hypothetical protein LUZ60_002418 [Juncus effusus]|nr:hypothetical protein LUZ60_002418 [Juncus effusus]